jgi:CelD/BcsL family acetyltransferase involved in cellulose biosynthesis
MTSTDLTIRILTAPEQLSHIASDWSDLWQCCPSPTTFQSPDWLISWIETFCPAELLVIELRAGSQLAGLAALLIYERDGERVLAFAGGGVSDYLDILAHPDHENQVVESLLETIADQPGWTVLDLTDLPANSVLLKSPLLSQFTHEHDTCSALLLPETTDQLWHLLSTRQRANLRNARCRLKRIGGGQVELATAETLPEFLQDLFRLHTSRWSLTGQPGVLNDEHLRTFHQRSAPLLLERRSLSLYRLRSQGRTLAVLQSFLDHQTAFCYLQGFDPESSFVSPGTQLMFAVLEDAIRAGIRKFDFLRGTESYKLHWRAQSEPTFSIQLSRAALVSSPQALAA